MHGYMLTHQSKVRCKYMLEANFMKGAKYQNAKMVNAQLHISKKIILINEYFQSINSDVTNFTLPPTN